jgi:simple sugar transport system permease protein
LAVVGAVAAGALWALVPGMLRVRSGTDEVITSLMMNFIGILLLQYVTGGPLKDPSGSGQVTASRTINSAFRLTDTSGVSPALVLITAAVCLLVWLYVNRSTVGLQATLAGRNPMMARWQGINVGRLGLLGFALGGGLAGLAGSLELLGPSGRLVGGFYPGLGFTAILVPLMANLNVLGSIAAALFFGGLSSAILYIPIVTALPHSAFDLLNGVVAMLITVRLVSMPRLRSLVPKSSLGRGGTATRNADEGGH